MSILVAASPEDYPRKMITYSTWVEFQDVADRWPRELVISSLNMTPDQYDYYLEKHRNKKPLA